MIGTSPYFRRFGVFLAGLLGISLLYAVLVHRLNIDLFGYNFSDSYTLEALAWRAGHTFLSQDYSWLELAHFHNRVYVSFPPVPALVSLLTLPFFGNHAPANLLVILYAVGSYIALFILGKRLGATDRTALFWSLFAVLGCSLLTITLYGGVWFEAQALNFLLTSASLALMYGRRRSAWITGLILFALSIGCRPLQSVFLPVYGLLLYRNLQAGRQAVSPRSLLSYLVGPAFILGAMAAYNYVRFGNPLEFGHAYLPEFLTPGHPQFSLKYVLPNLQEHLLFIPQVTLSPFRADLPWFNGFVFFIANPLYSSYFLRFWRPKKDLLLLFIFLLAIADFFLTLSHATMGGFQFGSRYTIDILPFIFLAILISKPKITALDALLAIFGVSLNLYGCIRFTHMLLHT